MEHNRVYTSYLRSAFEPDLFKRTVNVMVKVFKTLDFDAIAFRGMSGSLFAPVIAQKLGKKLVMVRKDGDGNHSGMLTEGWRMTDKVVIIDDLISTGETMNRLIADLNRSRRNTLEGKEGVKLVGVFLYHDCNQYADGVPNYALKEESRQSLAGVPVYSMCFSEHYEPKTHIRFYANNRVRNIIGLKPLAEEEYNVIRIRTSKKTEETH